MSDPCHSLPVIHVRMCTHPHTHPKTLVLFCFLVLAQCGRGKRSISEFFICLWFGVPGNDTSCVWKLLRKLSVCFPELYESVKCMLYYSIIFLCQRRVQPRTVISLFSGTHYILHREMNRQRVFLLFWLEQWLCPVCHASKG